MNTNTYNIMLINVTKNSNWSTNISSLINKPNSFKTNNLLDSSYYNPMTTYWIVVYIYTQQIYQTVCINIHTHFTGKVYRHT